MFNWLTPANSALSSFPITLRANLTNWQKVEKIDFYYQKVGSDLEQYINHLEPLGAEIALIWDKKPEVGDYTIYANFFDYRGKKYQSEKISLTIK